MREIMTVAEEKALLARFANAAGAGEMLNIHDLKRAYEQAIGHGASNSTVYNLLDRHDWRKLMPRPFHPKRDVDAQNAFKKTAFHALRGERGELPPSAVVGCGSCSPARPIGRPLDALAQLRRNEIRQLQRGFCLRLCCNHLSLAGPRQLRGALLRRKAGLAIPDCAGIRGSFSRGAALRAGGLRETAGAVLSGVRAARCYHALRHKARYTFHRYFA